MNTKSTRNTKKKISLKRIADIQSGVYIRNLPVKRGVAYLQVKDLMMPAPDLTATKVEYMPKLEKYMLQRGDLLFAGKGANHLCKVFDHDIPAIPSTTLYYIRLHSDVVSPQYLCWYLNHPKVVAAIKTVQVGSGTPLIHKPTLENLEIIIPDKETQQRIVALSELQKREEFLLKAIAEKRVQITNQILINELNK
ncbi:MAG: restriction endonuclease subunit S [Bacteroidaceae bacterium]|nr:restriction endonuclease subunit S [Bacteroidaceae bacterium]